MNAIGRFISRAKSLGLSTIVAAGGFFTPLASHSAPLDFDSDGKSDRTVVSIESDGTLLWNAQNDSAAVSLGEAGSVGDNLIPGPWLTAGVPLIGYLRAVGSTVTWNIPSDSGIQSVNFGSTSDTLIAGGDFNGDGLIDGAYTSASGASLIWHLSTALFSNGSEETISFGRKLNTAFFYNPGSTHDWLAVLVKPASGSLRVVIKDPAAGTRRVQARISRSLINFSRPVPLAREDGSDNFLFVRKGSAKTTAVVVDPEGKVLARTSVAEAVDVVVGEFLSDPGEELAFASSSGYVAFNPQTKASSTLSSPSGIAVDEVNVNTFASSEDPDLPTPRDSCYDGDPTDGFKTGFIWKPASDTQFGAVVILPGIYRDKVRKVETTTTSGTVIRDLDFKGNANPDPGGAARPHYIDRTMQGAEYRRKYRSIYVRAEFINGACMQYLIENPGSRTD